MTSDQVPEVREYILRDASYKQRTEGKPLLTVAGHTRRTNFYKRLFRVVEERCVKAARFFFATEPSPI